MLSPRVLLSIFFTEEKKTYGHSGGFEPTPLVGTRLTIYPTGGGAIAYLSDYLYIMTNNIHKDRDTRIIYAV